MNPPWRVGEALVMVLMGQPCALRSDRFTGNRPAGGGTCPGVLHLLLLRAASGRALGLFIYEQCLTSGGSRWEGTRRAAWRFRCWGLACVWCVRTTVGLRMKRDARGESPGALKEGLWKVGGASV